MRRFLIVTTILVLGGTLAPAAEIDIFRASKAGPDAFQWGGAKIQREGGELVVTEQNKDGSFGDVFTADHLPYFADGVIELYVSGIVTGNCNLQVLGFKGDEHVGTADAMKGVATVGPQSVAVKSLNLAGEPDSIVLKLWVEGSEGVAIKFADLAYVLPVDDAKLSFDETFATAAAWESDGVVAKPAAAGAELSLAEGKTYGSVLRPQRVAKDAGNLLMLDVAAARDGVVTVQLAQFDDVGSYLESLDVIKDVGAGLHIKALDSLAWNPQAETYTMKVWLAGNPNANATVRRMVLTKP